jgi:alpha-ribazole phosphatase
MKIYLLRHTRLLDGEGLCYGRHDLPLTNEWELEANRILTTVPADVSEIWSSPAQRCWLLAERLAQGRPYRVDTRLEELSFGQWEGQPWENVRGAEADAWFANPWSERPPGGETVPEMQERVSAFREEVLASPGTKLVVTHAGVIRVWRALAQKRPIAEAFSEPVPYGEVLPIE